MTVKNAYEFKEEYGRDGKCLKRERAIGAIVIWGVVALVALATGKVLDLSAAFWHLVK